MLCRRELLALIRTTFNSGFKCLTVGPAGHADLFPIKTDSFDAISLEWIPQCKQDEKDEIAKQPTTDVGP